MQQKYILKIGFLLLILGNALLCDAYAGVVTQTNWPEGSGSGSNVCADVTNITVTTTTYLAVSTIEIDVGNAEEILNNETTTTVNQDVDNNELTTATSSSENGIDESTTLETDTETNNDNGSGDSEASTEISVGGSSTENSVVSSGTEVSIINSNVEASITSSSSSTEASTGSRGTETTSINSSGTEASIGSSNSSSSSNTDATKSSNFQCTSAGIWQNPQNCTTYYTCDPIINIVNTYQLNEWQCPPLTAYSPNYERCTRDLSACQQPAHICLTAGKFADSSNPSYYIWCVPNIKGDNYYKFLVRCPIGQSYYDIVGGCWPTNVLDLQQASGSDAYIEAIDLAAIKLDLKHFKSEEKKKLKAQKQHEKLLRKQMKTMEKQAKKAAKQQSKKQAKANSSEEELLSAGN